MNSFTLSNAQALEIDGELSNLFYAINNQKLEWSKASILQTEPLRHQTSDGIFIVSALTIKSGGKELKCTLFTDEAENKTDIQLG